MTNEKNIESDCCAPERFRLGNIYISAVTRSLAYERISQLGQGGQGSYVCVTNARTVDLANRNQAFCEVQNQSQMTLPDGAPLVWMGRRLGFAVERVTGPGLMMEFLLRSRESAFSHYFYGGSERTAGRIKERLQSEFPDVSVKGVVAPAFQPIEAFDLDSLALELNRLRPSFFWCGLGAPKQEFLIARLAPKLTATVCIGVGLAFDYFAGTVHMPPSIVRKLRLEWLYRCAQQPIKARRFIRPFASTLWMMSKVYIITRSGVKG